MFKGRQSNNKLISQQIYDEREVIKLFLKA